MYFMPLLDSPQNLVYFTSYKFHFKIEFVNLFSFSLVWPSASKLHVLELNFTG